jgi:hypothetical protein
MLAIPHSYTAQLGSVRQLPTMTVFPEHRSPRYVQGTFGTFENVPKRG